MERRLVDLEEGKTGLVRRLDGQRNLISRLATLGFTVGVPVKVVRNGAHGPLLVNIRGVQVALGHGEAERILVSPAEEDSQIAGSGQNMPAVTYSIALAGQPNVGKSTVFNMLTGLNQHVGNWTGKTVEQKIGFFSYNGRRYELVDLPGTYSLTANSEEELIAREFILRQRPDLVVAVVDAATLERNLYLVAELLQLPVPVVVALNMMDVAEAEGVAVEPQVLASALGIPVVPMAAARNQGMQQLLDVIEKQLDRQLPYEPKRPTILPAHLNVLKELEAMIQPFVPEGYPSDWVAIKLLEGDEDLSAKMQAAMSPAEWKKVDALMYQHEDAVLDIAGARYQWIGRMIRAAVVEPPASRVGLTARLDRVLTHPLLGTLALALALGAAFWLTYAVGTPVQKWLSDWLSALGENVRVSLAAAPAWLSALLVDGVFGGLGMVLTFLPILAIFYFVLGFLEDTGYMARAAYLTDRWMHSMGLHGKSFLPILLGFGCNVPAVLGTRIIESKRARLLTTLLVPFVPCTARMAVVAVLAPLFFGSAAVLVTWGLVVGNILLLAGVGLLLHRFAFKDEHVAFIMELPLYHLPNFKTIGLYVWHNLIGFLQKAGTVILLASLVVWSLSYFPTGEISTSFLGVFGRWLEPVGRLMGLPWQMLIALLTSVAAKENTIATIGVLYGDLSASLPGLLGLPAALAMLVFQMLFIPCVGTIAALKAETRSWRWTLFSLTVMLALSFGLAVAVYQLGRLF